MILADLTESIPGFLTVGRGQDETVCLVDPVLIGGSLEVLVQSSLVDTPKDIRGRSRSARNLLGRRCPFALQSQAANNCGFQLVGFLPFREGRDFLCFLTGR